MAAAVGRDLTLGVDHDVLALAGVLPLAILLEVCIRCRGEPRLAIVM